ncbi:MAG: amino acid ABC transporter substrate-binding protein [Proteobacteria bacterium]|nr:amino acid ABC transporter substrate-binding protein [Pseudomonadota bacterium]
MERRTFGKLAVAGAAAGIVGKASAENKPFTIGFGMALTGSLAPNGKSALLGMQIWEQDVNARGGLLGRPVKLVYYDDASNPSNVPGIYTKLLDVDKVDIVTSGYATNMVAPAMPIVMQHDRVFFSLLGLAVNSEFHYPRYFSIAPTGGPNPKQAFSEGFFAVAMEQNPKPQTVAITGADAEFPRNALDGVRAQVKKYGLKIVYDKTYPPNTADYTPVVRAVAATNPDIYFSASYPADTVGIIRAAHEVGFKPKLFGGGMVGLQATAIKTQLGPLLNGIVTYDFWLPWAGFATDEGRELIKKYQARSAAAGVDLLGYYLPPFGYALCQVVEQAVKATGGTNDDKIAEYARKNTFKTVAGDIRFNADGEWQESQVMAVQFQGITGNSVDQFRDPKTEVILWPTKYRTGKIIYPYDPGK